jgi:hypothetical protein
VSFGCLNLFDLVGSELNSRLGMMFKCSVGVELVMVELGMI